MKPGPNDVKLAILITGDELLELKRFTTDMVEAFGLDRRIEGYSGKRSIGLGAPIGRCFGDLAETATSAISAPLDVSTSAIVEHCH